MSCDLTVKAIRGKLSSSQSGLGEWAAWSVDIVIRISFAGSREPYFGQMLRLESEMVSRVLS